MFADEPVDIVVEWEGLREEEQPRPCLRPVPAVAMGRSAVRWIVRHADR
jgi:hypothetical protein